MADRDPLDAATLLEMSDARMHWALNPDNTHPLIDAIDSLRLALISAERDLVAALDERAALATGAADQIMAATELRQYLDTVENALHDPDFAAEHAARRLARVVRAGIAAGAAPALLHALLVEDES